MALCSIDRKKQEIHRIVLMEQEKSIVKCINKWLDFDPD
jgi:hypothetical protein